MSVDAWTAVGLVEAGTDTASGLDPFDFSDVAVPAALARPVTLPAMLGDYRPVEGRPGWFMRRMRLREEIRMQQLLDGIPADRPGTALALSARAVGACLLWRVTLPDDPEGARAALVQAVQSGQFGSVIRPATEAEVEEEFDSQTLRQLVLEPMGFGVPEAGEGNA
jgi:hypothetical protein